MLATAFSAVIIAAPQQGLKWKKNTINISISTSLFAEGPNLPSASETALAINRSINVWESSAALVVRSTTSPLQNVDPPGRQGDGVSLITIAQTPQNLALFPKGVEDVAALTRVFFDGRGSITEADIVLNPFLQFSTGGVPGTFDLQATITHEIGHLLGLNHSDVLGSTMSENNTKNGVYNLSGFAPRTLSPTDIAAIRSLYGAPVAETECCGSVGGKLNLRNAKPAVNWLVWAEDVTNGYVAAAARTGADGAYILDGLNFGSFRLFAQPAGAAKTGFAAEVLGEVTVNGESQQPFSRQVANRSTGFELSFIGFGGQLAGPAVLVNSGHYYTVYVGGRGIDAEQITLGSDSPWIRIGQGTVSSLDFGKGLSVVSFEVTVSRNAPPGDYSLFARSPSGSARFLVGGLTVERFPNLLANGISQD